MGSIHHPMPEEAVQRVALHQRLRRESGDRRSIAVFRRCDWCICVYPPGASFGARDPYSWAASGVGLEDDLEIIGATAPLRKPDRLAIMEAAKDLRFERIEYIRHRADGRSQEKVLQL